MAIHNFTGTFTRPDNSVPQDKTITGSLITPFLVAGGAIITQYEVTTPINNGDGSFSKALIVPDDPAESANYVFYLPDGQEFRGKVNQNSPTDFATFLNANT